MMLMILDSIENEVKKYTEAYCFYNHGAKLHVALQAFLNDEDKELLLNDIDKNLPYGYNFKHDYNPFNGELKIIFEELV